jgi:hypothetical protein
MTVRTLQQNNIMFSIFKKLGIEKEERQALALQYSNNRTDSTKMLFKHEAEALINDLNKQTGADVADRMRKKIISQAKLMGWIIPGTNKADMDHINAWCINYGQFKKKLNEHSLQELPKLVSQFERAYKSYLKNL